MRCAIEELTRHKGKGRSIAVLGDMLELGERAAEEHRSLGEFLSSSGVDFTVVYGNYAEYVLEGTSGKVDGVAVKTHREASGVVAKVAKSGDIVLIKGSRAMRMEKVIEELFRE